VRRRTATGAAATADVPDLTAPAPDAPAPEPASPPGRFDRTLIAPMLLGSILNPVNSSMLAVALIPIGDYFDVSPAQTAWLITGLYLATAVGQPVMGRLVDLFGPKPLYLVGTSIVGVAGLMGAFAPALGVLIASRVLLGIGTSAAYPAAMSLIRSESERTGQKSPAGVLSMLTIANQVIVVIGPTTGGLLIGLGGWHLIFTVNAPLSLACLVLGALYLPARTRRSTARGLSSIDIPGMLLFAGALVALMLFLMQPRLARTWLLAVMAAIVVVFVLRELRVPTPFVDVRVLRGNGPLLATYGRQLLAYTTSYAFIYGYPQWLEEGRSLSPSAAGMVLLPMSAGAIVITAITGRRAAVRRKLLAGSLIQLSACAALLLVGSASPIWTLVLVGMVVGLPQGLNGLANQNALYHQAAPERLASSAGLLRTCNYLGALVAAAAQAAFYDGGATSTGLHHLSWFLMGVAGVLLVMALADRSLSRIGAAEDAERRAARRARR